MIKAMSTSFSYPALALVLLGLSGLTGCQTTVGGQTLPSAYYLDDDVQYFPAGTETQLSNQIRALEEYRLERENLQNTP